VLVVAVKKARQVSVPAELYVLVTHEMRLRLGVAANAMLAVVRTSMRVAHESRLLPFEKSPVNSITSNPF
jgi:hypothetical protein